jgi:hypothetical protein
MLKWVENPRKNLFMCMLKFIYVLFALSDVVEFLLRHRRNKLSTRQTLSCICFSDNVRLLKRDSFCGVTREFTCLDSKARQRAQKLSSRKRSRMCKSSCLPRNFFGVVTFHCQLSILLAWKRRVDLPVMLSYTDSTV